MDKRQSRTGNHRNPAFTLPRRKDKSCSSLTDKFERQTLENNPWGQFLLFVEDTYGKYIPDIKEEHIKRLKYYKLPLKL